ncbi:MAG: hypothetical protein K2P81_08780 [Bacteriovoracaceae bacterium]|nr:hypothetical protein [Bacteriovoracaceae bacterium]
MLKPITLFFALIFSLSSFAIESQKILVPSDLSEKEGTLLVEELFQSGRNILQSSTFALESSEKSAQYPSGDFVLLWGLGEETSNQDMTQSEYNKIWRIMNYLKKMGFRVIMNVRAEGADVKEAVETEGTSVVLYSGHGNTSGFYDFFSRRVTYDLFKNKAKSVYQFILSACHGTESRVNYAPPKDMIMYTWEGLTNTDDLMTFLMGSWTGMEGKNLAIR